MTIEFLLSLLDLTLYIFSLCGFRLSLSLFLIYVFGRTRSHLLHVGSLVAEYLVEACEPLAATCGI